MPVDFWKKEPKTFEEALAILTENIEPEEADIIKSDGPMLHMTVGMAMRNEWRLWHDSDLAKHFKARYGLGHADDMSGMLMKALECHVCGKEYHDEFDAERYRKFWRDQGIDPLTQKKM